MNVAKLISGLNDSTHYMQTVIPAPSSKHAAFSLIEVTVALAIVAFAVIALIGILPTALEDAGFSSDQTALGSMLEDISDRIKSEVLTETEEDSPILHFYDQRGFYLEPPRARDSDSIASVLGDSFFRVEVALRKPDPKLELGETLAAQIKIFWPLNEDKEPVHPNSPGREVTFLVGTRTGPEWKEIDSSYEAKIE